MVVGSILGRLSQQQVPLSFEGGLGIEKSEVLGIT